jgi:hypothetical protein
MNNYPRTYIEKYMFDTILNKETMLNYQKIKTHKLVL